MGKIKCPWSLYEVDPFPFCEAQLCAIIGQPANTWTNIGYLIVSILLLRDKNLNSQKYLFAFVTLCLALGSGIFHMTGTLWAKKLDLTAMLMLSSLILSSSLARSFFLNQKKTIGVFSALLLSAMPVIGIGRGGSYIFILQSLIGAALEIINVRKNRTHPSNQQLKLMTRALAVFMVAMVINILDQNKILCHPDNHILTGHGIWHLMTAYCIWLVARYYSSSQ